jgi:hypothetical protein
MTQLIGGKTMENIITTLIKALNILGEDRMKRYRY